MKPLRILLVMIDPPLPFGTAPARWYYVLLQNLVDRGHQVTAFAPCRAGEMEQVRNLFAAPAYDLRCYPNPERSGIGAKWETLRRPYSYMFGPQLCQDLHEELTRGFDILHLESLWSGWMGLAHADRAILNVHNSLQIDLDGQAPGSLTEKARRINAFRAERSLLCRYPTICTVSSRLSARVRDISPGSSVHTLPLSMDLSLYPFRNGKCEGRDPVVGLIGSFDWQPTYSAAVKLITRLWPAIKKRVPNAKLQLIGRRARARLAQFAGLPDVDLHEDVPDILPYFRNLDLLLYAPNAGSGVKVKILEAFALGVPVVTNNDGIEGIPVIDGMHAEVCESDEGLIDRALQLLQNPERQRSRAQAARQLVESHCAPRTAVRALEEIYYGLN